jgi:hypothetical protein
VSSREEIKEALASLVKDGLTMLQNLRKKEKPEGFVVYFDYQNWYSKALPVMRALGADRLEEFKRYYEPDPKRKALGYGTYVIQDFLKGVAPGGYNLKDFDTKAQAAHCLLNQVALLTSVQERIDSVLSDLERALFADLKDAELSTASALLKVSPRAAGALAGVVLEAHLQRVADANQVTIKKRNPTMSDLNEPLKQAGIYDMPTWRKISYLADIRNLCSHKKGDDPRPEQVQELIDGVNWALKTIA